MGAAVFFRLFESEFYEGDRDAERTGLHSHAERGNDQRQASIILQV